MYSEICCILKPSGISLPIHIITKSGNLALQKIQLLHQKLNQSLESLELEVNELRQLRLEQARQYRVKTSTKEQIPSEMDIVSDNYEVAGIDKDDPILQWSNLHFAVPLKE